MKKKKKKLKKIKIDKYFGRRIILLFLLVILITFIISLIRNKKEEKPELSVLYNNNIINFNDTIIIDDSGRIYFSKEDVKNIFDETIYYNEAEKELITTYNKHVALLKVDENYMMVNDSHIDLDGYLQEINKKVYLPMKDLTIVYDIEIEYAGESNKIIIDSINNEKTEAKVSKNIKVKEKDSIFSNTIEKLNKDEKIYILESNKKYNRIRTENGNIGYIKNKYIYEENKIRDKWEESVLDLNILSEYNTVSGNYQVVFTNKEKLNIVIPTLFYLDDNLKVLDKSNSTSEEFKNYINWANSNEILVIPTFKNNAEVSKNLLTYSQRNKVINQLYDLCVKNGLKGVNINFETIDDINSFNRFIIEIVPKFKESGLKVCVTLNKNINKEKIENVVEYLIEEK